MRGGIILTIIIIAAVSIGGLLYLFGGAAFHPDASSAANKQKTNANFTVLAQGTMAASIDQRVNYRITDAEQLAELWNVIYTNNGSSVPNVDFSQKEVLAVFDGSHSTDGYGIYVRDVTEKENKRMITIVHTEPGTSCSLRGIATSPFSIVLLDKSRLPVSHTDESETTFCP